MRERPAAASGDRANSWASTTDMYCEMVRQARKSVACFNASEVVHYHLHGAECLGIGRSITVQDPLLSPPGCVRIVPLRAVPQRHTERGHR